MPGRTGLEAAERTLAEKPEQVVILFSAFLDENITRTADRVGVRACVSRNDATRLIDRLRECAAA